MSENENYYDGETPQDRARQRKYIRQFCKWAFPGAIIVWTDKNHVFDAMCCGHAIEFKWSKHVHNPVLFEKKKLDRTFRILPNNLSLILLKYFKRIGLFAAILPRDHNFNTRLFKARNRKGEKPSLVYEIPLGMFKDVID